jgi:hypothetical protein
MFGRFIGVPAGILVALGLSSIPLLGPVLPVCVGLLVWWLLARIDAKRQDKLDYPDPIRSKDPVPVAFGKINELLRETQHRQAFWNIRTLDTDELRILASLKFVEVIDGMGKPPDRLARLIMLEARLRPIEGESTFQSETVLTYSVEMPAPSERSFTDMLHGRLECDRVIATTTAAIEECLGQSVG